MVLNIKVSETQILERDTSFVRKEFEGLIQSSTLIKKHENDITLNFQGLTSYDMLKKLKSEEFKTWFKKLDKELPGLPYFLSEPSNTMLFFLMGNISYEEKESNVQFDKIEAARFFKEKVLQMRNLCLAHNINPQTGIIRLSKMLSGEKDNDQNNKNQTTEKSREESSENTGKKNAIKDFLDKYGSIAFLNNDRTVKITLVINEIPQKISFLKNFLVKDNSYPQQFFMTVIKTDSGISEIRSLIIASIADVENSITQNKGIYIQVVTKSEDGSYQRLFESDNPFNITVTTSLKDDLLKIETESHESFSNIDPKSTIEEHEKNLEKHSVIEKTLVADDDTENDGNELMQLKKENSQLLAKIEKMEKLIEIYEDEINKKRSIKGFFGKFFN